MVRDYTTALYEPAAAPVTVDRTARATASPPSWRRGAPASAAAWSAVHDHLARRRHQPGRHRRRPRVGGRHRRARRADAGRRAREVLHGIVGHDGEFHSHVVVPLSHVGDGTYRGDLVLQAPGNYGVTARVIPVHPALASPVRPRPRHLGPVTPSPAEDFHKHFRAFRARFRDQESLAPRLQRFWGAKSCVYARFCLWKSSASGAGARRGQWPVKVALPGPWARKLATPVAASSVPNTSTKASRSRALPSASGSDSPRVDHPLARAPGRRAAHGPPRRRAPAPARGGHRRPTSSASPIASGLRHRHLAAGEAQLLGPDAPTARARRCVPPPPGMMPSRISGWPNTARVPATR